MTSETIIFLICARVLNLRIVLGTLQAIYITLEIPLSQPVIPPLRVLRLPAVVARTGLSRSFILAKLNPSHRSFDPHFPKRIRLGIKAVGWVESDLDEWIEKARVV